jgi:hypothetical protein
VAAIKEASVQIDFARGDIVISKPGYTGGCYCILDVDTARPDYPYSSINLVTLLHYHLPRDTLIKVGTAMPEFLQDLMASASTDEVGAKADQLRCQRGQVRAMHKVWETAGDTQKRWRILANAKAGSKINVHYEGDQSVALIFRHVVERSTRYVFVADDPFGRRVRFTLDSVCLVQPDDVEALDVAQLALKNLVSNLVKEDAGRP